MSEFYLVGLVGVALSWMVALRYCSSARDSGTSFVAAALGGFIVFQIGTLCALAMLNDTKLIPLLAQVAGALFGGFAAAMYLRPSVVK